jgi:SAM-dependent methyltransferase
MSSTSSGEPALDAEAVVAAIYRAVLRREPDPGGAALYAGLLRRGQDLTWLLHQFLASPEYAALHRLPSPTPVSDLTLDRAPPMPVEAYWDAADRQALWDHIAGVWSRYGQTEPHWSVITDDRFRADKIDENLPVFQDTGANDVARLDAWLDRNGLSVHGACAEYGCGVGRVTAALARRFERVTGFDISGPHLQIARRRLDADALGNADLVQVRSPADLEQLSGIDLFFSVIVLQHNPPPIMIDVLDRAFAGLNSGGVAYFQIPTYGLGYRFSAEQYRADIGGITEMEIHFLPQSVVFELAARHGLIAIETQPDDWLGNRANWISTTFLFRKAS